MVETRMKAIKLELANIMIAALGVAVIMRDRVYQEEGLPAKVISDWGPQFISCLIREFYRLVGIEGNLSMAYYPQMDGQME
jgi:transposase InsO family protein